MTLLDLVGAGCWGPFVRGLGLVMSGEVDLQSQVRVPQEEYPVRTWADHGSPAIGVWRSWPEPGVWRGDGLGQLVTMRALDEMVVVTFECGARVKIRPDAAFGLSPLSRGVSLVAARALLEAIATDVPDELAARLAAVRSEIAAAEVVQDRWLWPDARERAARWLWQTMTADAAAWPAEVELRAPFYALADGLLAEITGGGWS